MNLHVLDPGLASKVVDFGRPGSRSLGVPVGGAADRAALALANALVGNAPDAAGLEICLKGPVLCADGAMAGVLFGAPFSLASARQRLHAGVTFNLQAGEEIHIGGTAERMRAYLCVRGGLQVPPILHSFSGLDFVKEGESYVCEPSGLPSRFFPAQVSDQLSADRSLLRTLPGAQAKWFDEAALHDRQFTVSPALNRMGIRLEGRPLKVPEQELVSEPVCPGAVQVTTSGQCIVLGVDGQTIGGYPKIAQVIQADLDGLAQLRPGESVRFQQVTLAEASALFHERQAFLHEWIVRARVSLDGWASLRKLDGRCPS